MRSGAEYYARRIENEDPVLVRVDNVGRTGVVHRVTPSGRMAPSQSFVVWHVVTDDGFREVGSGWVPTSLLRRVKV